MTKAWLQHQVPQQFEKLRKCAHQAFLEYMQASAILFLIVHPLILSEIQELAYVTLYK